MGKQKGNRKSETSRDGGSGKTGMGRDILAVALLALGHRARHRARHLLGARRPAHRPRRPARLEPGRPGRPPRGPGPLPGPRLRRAHPPGGPRRHRHRPLPRPVTARDPGRVGRLRRPHRRRSPPSPTSSSPAAGSRASPRAGSWGGCSAPAPRTLIGPVGTALVGGRRRRGGAHRGHRREGPEGLGGHLGRRPRRLGWSVHRIALAIDRHRAAVAEMRAEEAAERAREEELEGVGRRRGRLAARSARGAPWPARWSARRSAGASTTSPPGPPPSEEDELPAAPPPRQGGDRPRSPSPRRFRWWSRPSRPEPTPEPAAARTPARSGPEIVVSRGHAGARQEEEVEGGARVRLHAVGRGLPAPLGEPAHPPRAAEGRARRGGHAEGGRDHRLDPAAARRRRRHPPHPARVRWSRSTSSCRWRG